MWSNLTVDCGPNAGWVFFHWYRQTQLSRACPLTTGMSFQRDITMAGTETRKLSPLVSENMLPTHPHTPTLPCKHIRSCETAAALVCCCGGWTQFSGGNDSVVETCTLGNINPSVAVPVLSQSFSAKTAKNLPHFSAADCGSFRLEREGGRERDRQIDRERERSNTSRM